MSPQPITRNTLFYGDNLDILREYLPTESVDLIYLDPPFNSSRSYNVLFKDESGLDSEAQITAFEDTWHWGQNAEDTLRELYTGGRASHKVSVAMEALEKLIGRNNQMMAYLVMMTARLVELHRVLKPTGSLYLHCDPTASHYLKVILDAIFGGQSFRNEIVWRRTRGHNDKNLTKYGAIHDVIFFYAKGDSWTYNTLYHDPDEDAPKTHDLYEHTDGKLYRKGDCTAPGGRGPRYEWNGHIRNWRFTQEEAKRLEAEGRIVYTRSGMPRVLRPAELDRGIQLQDTWADIDPPNSGSKEILNYPTQKPEALLERIIAASSNPGDVVLDPFAGCGTAIAAAEKLGRRWIGIDITHLSINLLKNRLKTGFGKTEKRDYDVIGEPTTVADAYQLATDSRFQFEYWALSLVQARPAGGQSGRKQGKQGADRGIDGIITFIDEASAAPKRIIVQVKSGQVHVGYVRDLVGTLEREKAAMGVLITLERPTGPMLTEALSAGVYHSAQFGRDYPRIQILAIEDLLAGQAGVQMPLERTTFKQAGREQDSGAEQQRLL